MKWRVWGWIFFVVVAFGVMAPISRGFTQETAKDRMRVLEAQLWEIQLKVLQSELLGLQRQSPLSEKKQKKLTEQLAQQQQMQQAYDKATQEFKISKVADDLDILNVTALHERFNQIKTQFLEAQIQVLQEEIELREQVSQVKQDDRQLRMLHLKVKSLVQEQQRLTKGFTANQGGPMLFCSSLSSALPPSGSGGSDCTPGIEQFNTSVNVPTNFTVGDVNVRLYLSHDYPSDLRISLQSPIGTSAIIVGDVGGSDFGSFGTTCSPLPNFVIDDEASSFIPDVTGTYTGSFLPSFEEEPGDSLSIFDGEPAQGSWTLSICDDAESDTGTFNCWCLEISEGQPIEQPVLFSADTTNNRIQAFDGFTWNVVAGGAAGSALGQFRLPEAVAFGLGGSPRLYVADTGNNRIQWSTDGGSTWQLFASIGSAQNQVRAPQGLVVDSEGNLYVADTGNGRVLRFDDGVPGFGFVLASNGAGSGQVGAPHGLAIDANFTLFIADQLNSKILKLANANTITLSNKATLVASLGVALNKVKNPQGVAVDDSGNLFIADTGNNRVLQFPNGNANQGKALAQVGAGLGQVNAPEGVTVSRFQNSTLNRVVFNGPYLVVSDTGNNRIQGRLVANTAQQWDLVGFPNGSGTGTGQFRRPSKIR